MCIPLCTLLLGVSAPVPLSTFSLTCLIFLSGDRHARDLHSFPTRRSSDLAGFEAYFVGGSVRDYLLNHEVNDLINNRSEEHTSELQSRGHLVCRLLLAKKKGGAD